MLAVTPLNTRYLVLQNASISNENDLGTMWTIPWRWGIYMTPIILSLPNIIFP